MKHKRFNRCTIAIAVLCFQFAYCNADDPTQLTTTGKTKIDSGDKTLVDAVDNTRSRAMNFSSNLHGDYQNGIHDSRDTSSISSSHLPKEHRLDDVSIDDSDEDFNTFNTSLLMPHFPINEVFSGNMSVVKNITTECVDKGKTYKVGEKFNRGCDETCQCLNGGEIICSAQCKPPYFKRGYSKKDHLCTEQPIESNPCCVLLKCADSIMEIEQDPEHTDRCIHKNETYKIGTTFNDGCEAVCLCEKNGDISCKSRCPPVRGVGKSCITLPDVKDPCCPVVLCDVEDHEGNKIGVTASDESLLSSMSDNQLISAVPTNSTAVRLTFADKSSGTCEVEISLNGVEWNKTRCPDSTVSGLHPGKTYFFRLKNNLASNTVKAVLPGETTSKMPCEYKGKTYSRGEEFHDGCEAYCVCDKTGIECAPIECPTDFGLDVLDPQCLDWETHPAGFIPTPPNCCPDKVHCRDNGSCTYNGENFPNWSEIPTKLSGCDKRCYCELGNVTCQQVCPTVPDSPPPHLPCGKDQAILTHIPGDDCCLIWICPNNGPHGKLNLTSVLEDKHPATNTIPNVTLVTNSTVTTNRTNIIYNNNLRSSSIQPVVTMTLPAITPTRVTTDSTASGIDSKHGFSGMKNPEIPPFKNITFKKPTIYSGPFSPQFIELKDNNTKVYTKLPHKSSHNLLTELLTPFQLEQYIPEIEKDLEQNETTSEQKQDISTKKPHHHHIHHGVYDEMEDENEDLDLEDHSYDEEHDLFSGILHPSKTPVRPHNTQKQNLWTLKPDEIAEVVKNPHLTEYHATSKDYSTEKSIDPGKPYLPTDQKTGEYPKKHSPHINKDNVYPTKHKTTDNEEIGKDSALYKFPPPHRANIPLHPYEGNNFENSQGNFENLHTKFNGKYPSSKLPSQVQSFPDLLKQKFKTPILNSNEPEEIYHIIDETGYTDHSQFQPYDSQNRITPQQYGNVVALGNNAVSPLHNVQTPNTRVNIENILTHVRHEEANHFGYPNYSEGLNVDQSAHPIILHVERGNQHFGNQSSHQGFNEQDLIHNFPPLRGQVDNDIKIHILEPLNDNSVKLVFSVPPYLVGLHGRVELRYTSDKQNNELSTWDQQILAPPNDLIATQELEFELGGLQPNTTYKIKISVNMRDIDNMPSSEILNVRTLPMALPTTTLPSIIPIEDDLRVMEVNSTWVKLTWRVFTDFELQFIDGIQLRYKELDDKIYSATPLIHRAVTTYTIENLKPDSLYEFGIFFIPFARQTTELQAQRTIQIRTTIENDPYKFDLVLDVHHIKVSSVELSWSGIPYPEDKYVNIFRAIYQSDGNREDFSSFKVAKRDSPQSILIQDLKPNMRYRLWLEAYLTNGRIKKSNVKDFVTKSGSLPHTIKQGKLEGSPLIECNSYYGPLVGVSILAALAILASLILVLILAKKHATNKAPITNPIHSRKNNNSAAYDNPSYKICEDKPDNCSKLGSIPLAVFQINGKDM